MTKAIGFRPTEDDERINGGASRDDERTADVIRRALRLLDRGGWLARARADAERLADEDLSEEADARRYGWVLSPTDRAWSLATIVSTSAVFRTWVELGGVRTRFLVDQLRSVDPRFIDGELAFSCRSRSRSRSPGTSVCDLRGFSGPVGSDPPEDRPLTSLDSVVPVTSATANSGHERSSAVTRRRTGAGATPPLT